MNILKCKYITVRTCIKLTDENGIVVKHTFNMYIVLFFFLFMSFSTECRKKKAFGES